MKMHVANDVPVNAPPDNCLRIVLPSGITDVIVARDNKEMKVSL